MAMQRPKTQDQEPAGPRRIGCGAVEGKVAPWETATPARNPARLAVSFCDPDRIGKFLTKSAAISLAKHLPPTPRDPWRVTLFVSLVITLHYITLPAPHAFRSQLVASRTKLGLDGSALADSPWRAASRGGHAESVQGGERPERGIESARRRQRPTEGVPTIAHHTRRAATSKVCARSKCPPCPLRPLQRVGRAG